MGEETEAKLAAFREQREAAYTQALAGLQAGTYSQDELIAHIYAEANTTSAMIADVLAEVDSALGRMGPTFDALRQGGLMGLLRGTGGKRGD